MWDAARGGFYWSADDVVNPEAVKQVYGISFALYASAANYEATHDATAIELAKKTFGWLENPLARHRKRRLLRSVGSGRRPHSGDGRRSVRKAVPANARQRCDRRGLRPKSMNTHIHLLEALTELYGVWRDPLSQSDCSRSFSNCARQGCRSGGYQHQYFTPAWKPVPREDSYGHDIEAAYLLVEASAALGKPNDPRTWSVAQRLVDHTLQVGWDEVNGGVYDSGSAETGPSSAREQRKVGGCKPRLEQLPADARALWTKDQPLLDAFVKEWNFISRYQVDAVHMGWYGEVSREGVARPGAPKERRLDGGIPPRPRAHECDRSVAALGVLSGIFPAGGIAVILSGIELLTVTG